MTKKSEVDMRIRLERIMHPCRIGLFAVILGPAVAYSAGGMSSGGMSSGGMSSGGMSSGGMSSGGMSGGVSSGGMSNSGVSGGGMSGGGAGTGGSGRTDGASQNGDRIQSNCGFFQQCPAVTPPPALDTSHNWEDAVTPADRAKKNTRLQEIRKVRRAVSSKSPTLVPVPKRKGLRDTQATGLNVPAISSSAPAGPLPVPRPASISGSQPLQLIPTEARSKKMIDERRTQLINPLANKILSPPDTAPQKSSTLIMTEDNGNFVKDCSRRDVAILANNARFVLTGGCQSVTISGSNNRLIIEMAAGGEVDVLRQSNIVAWAKIDSGADPIVYSAGKANATVSLSTEPQPGSTQRQSDAAQSTRDPDNVPLNYMSEKIPQSSEELMILSSSNVKMVRDCTNKDVAVSASGSDVVLTGGCRSVTISGSGNKILAELSGGGELTVMHSGNAVAWDKVGSSAAPVIVHADPQNRTIELGAAIASRD
jgi:hypothetical protein